MDGQIKGSVPDLPGCCGRRHVEETAELMRKAIQMHLAGMREDSVPIPEPGRSLSTSRQPEGFGCGSRSHYGLPGDLVGVEAAGGEGLPAATESTALRRPLIPPETLIRITRATRARRAAMRQYSARLCPRLGPEDWGCREDVALVRITAKAATSPLGRDGFCSIRDLRTF